MSYEGCTFACCSFNGRFIYKIGGMEDNHSISSTIEVFDEKEGSWRIVKAGVSEQGEREVALASSAATQISQN
jgi:hypothetical protein